MSCKHSDEVISKSKTSKTKAWKFKIEQLGTREKFKKSELEKTSFIFFLDTLRCLNRSGGTIFSFLNFFKTQIYKPPAPCIKLIHFTKAPCTW